MSGTAIDLSVIVVSWNTKGDLLANLERLREAARTISLEIIVVDNGSVDGTAAAVRERFPEVTLLANRGNAGFGRANNQAFRHCRGRYFLLLNPDAEAEAGAFRGLIEFMDRTPDAGAAGLQLRHADGRLQNSFDSFPSMETEILSKHLLRILFSRRYPSKRTVHETPIEVDIVIGACLMLRPQVVRDLGGFDEDYFLFVEEADLCYRIWKAGWKIYHVPTLSVRHTFHHSKEQAPAHATIEYYRSNYTFFRKHRSYGVYVVFRLLKTLKLLLVSLNLSVIAFVLTLGRVPRYRRRLRIRALLAAWHLIGCPRAWGMRQVSGFRGYRRRWSSGHGCRREVIEAVDLPETLRGLLEDPERALCAPMPGSEGTDAGPVEVIKRTRRKTTCRVAAGGQDYLLTVHRPRHLLEAAARCASVPRGLWTFERALDVADREVRTVLPAGAGAVRGSCCRGAHVSFSGKRRGSESSRIFSCPFAARRRGQDAGPGCGHTGDSFVAFTTPA